MPVPRGLNLNQEAFVAAIVNGKLPADAYLSAGYKSKKRFTASVNSARLLKQPAIIEALAAARAEKKRIRDEATKLAIEHSGINQARVAVELGRIGFANMGDYMRVGPNGDPVLDFSNLTREQMAALVEVTVDDYIDGRGENARDVRKVRFKLGDKRAALMDIAKLFGWIVEKRENKIVDEFDTMSDEQIEEWLDEKAAERIKIRRRLERDPPRMRRGRQPARGKPH